MPATRSSSRIASIPLFPVKKPGPAGSPTKKKRATATDKDVPVAKRSKSTPTVKSSPRTVQVSVSSSGTPNEPKSLPTFNLKPAHLDPTRVIPANLGFDFQQAKKHLKEVDPRFGKVFETLPCRPFENLESVDPFRSLCTSIIGQQVSWLAARAINHKFRRLFDPGLPEKAGAGAGGDEGGLDGEKNSFPAPEDVLRLSIEQLRTAGLSGRKAEYVLSLAEHFRSGQLSTEFLATASVEEVSKALIGVRGIGQWTVDMFLIFTLRRPDILPVGDLGVQKGLLKWILAAYEHTIPVTPSVDIGKGKGDEVQDSSIIPAPASNPDPEAVPPPPTSIVSKTGEPAKQKKAEQKGLEKALLSLDVRPDEAKLREMFPLPEGMDVGLLRSRLGGKKAKGNVYLTPGEMEVLTQRWAPYRSLGVYYMWAVAEETGG